MENWWRYGRMNFVTEEILDSRWHWRRFQYLIKWKEYDCEHNSWESTSKVSTPELTVEFYHKHLGAPRHIWCTEFNNIFHPESIALRHSNLEGRVNIRGHLYLHPWTPWQHFGATLACLLVTPKHTSLAPILPTLTPKDVYNVEYPSRSLILISEDSPGGELYHSH